MSVGNQTVSFEVVPMEPGLSDFSRDFQPDLALDNTSSNMTFGLQEGVGPRYGIVPVRGHMLPFGASSAQGMRSAERATGFPAYGLNRNRAFGLATFSYDNKQYYCHIIGTSSSIFVGILCDLSGNEIDSIEGGFADSAAPYRNPSEYASSGYTFSLSSPYAHWARIASVTIRKGDEASPYLVTFNGALGTDGTAGYINAYDLFSVNRTYYTGLNPLFYGPDVRYSLTTRKVNLYAFGLNSGSDWALWKTREYNSFIGMIGATRIYRQLSYASSTTPYGYSVNFSGLTPNATTTIDATVTTALFSLVEDFELTLGLTYNVIAFAVAGKALGGIIAKEVRGATNGLFGQVDFCRPVVPKPRRTVNERSSTATEAYYLEFGTAKSTCWKYWPSYHDGTSYRTPPRDSVLSRARASNAHVCYGENNSGILRAGRDYEFAYSFYDKLTGVECNVGVPAKVRMPTVDSSGAAIDYMALSLYRREGTTSNCIAFEPSVQNIFGGDATDSDYPANVPVNHLKYRIYYRELGTFEWLPAAEVDAAQLMFDPKLDTVWACKNPLALSLGGQPGGFNDYSPLPDVTWIDVVEFKGRLFWFAEQQMIFSLRDNVFAYPIRNSTTLPSGGFRGGIVHANPGQAAQDARLVVFTSEAQYVGVFRGSGYGITSVIPVSATSTAEFELDGSDFYLDLRSSYSSFSSRSAVVADGLLYFWGPSGIFEDNGVELPSRISLEIDRILPTLYAPGKTERIHCVYNPETKEIIWFYPPASGTSVTKAIVFNRRIRKFYPYDFGPYRIDWAQSLNLVKTSADAIFSANRIMIGANSSEAGTNPQRIFWFDQKVHEGDMCCGRELICYYLTYTSATNIVRLRVDGSLTGVVAGDIVTLKNVNKYTSNVNIPDCKGVVVNVVSDDIFVQLPTGVSMTPASWITSYFEYDCFPVFVSSKHQINFTLRTRYWWPSTPRFWGWWKYVHFIFKVTNMTAATAPSITFAHRPIQTEAAEASYSLSLASNCDGYVQIMRALSAENQASIGQGLRFTWSGSHTGGEWYLQYMRCEVIPQAPAQLNIFEG